jgi:hypothetical protein
MTSLLSLPPVSFHWPGTGRVRRYLEHISLI